MSNKNHQKCISRIKKRQVNIDGAHEKNIFELLIKGHKAMSAYQVISVSTASLTRDQVVSLFNTLKVLAFRDE